MLTIYLSALPDPNDESKYEKFYREYRQLLLKVAYDHIHDPYLAEDCVHEVLFYIAEHFDKIGEVKSRESKGYALTITRAYANRFFNATTKELYLEDLKDEPDDGVDYADIAHGELDLALVMDCIEKLEDPYREVLILRTYHDLPYSEISKITGLTESNVRKILERGRKKLVRKLKSRKSEISGDTISLE